MKTPVAGLLGWLNTPVTVTRRFLYFLALCLVALFFLEVRDEVRWSARVTQYETNRRDIDRNAGRLDRVEGALINAGAKALATPTPEESR